MITKELPELEIENIKEFLGLVESASLEDLSKSLSLFGRQIIKAYEYRIINEAQKEKLNELKEYEREKKLNIKEKRVSEQLMLLEQYQEAPELFQVGLVPGRIVVASVQTIFEDKKDKIKSNGEILVIYKNDTPKAYELVKQKYTEHIKF